METRPRPSETQPVLTWASHAWRYALCLVISVAVWQSVAAVEWREQRLLFAAEVVLGVASYALVHARRRAPVPIALAIAAMSALSGIAAGPATLAAVSVATRRDFREVAVVGSANFIAAQTYTTLAPFRDDDPVITTLVNLVVNAGMMGWGLYIGSRREIIWSCGPAPSAPSGSRSCASHRLAPPSGRASRGRCTTSSRTASPRCPCRPARSRSATTSVPSACVRV